MTPTTTYPLIRDAWVSTLQALTPAYLPEKFTLFVDGPDLRPYAVENPGAVLRQFQIRRQGIRPTPPVSNLEVEQHEITAELAVAYPRDPVTYNRGLRTPRPLQDLEDVLDADAEQIIEALGMGGAANYTLGQSACWAESAAHEVLADVVILPIRLRTIFYRSV